MTTYEFLGTLAKNIYSPHRYKEYYWNREDNSVFYKDLSVSETKHIMHPDDTGLGKIEIEQRQAKYNENKKENDMFKEKQKNYTKRCEELYNSGLLGEDRKSTENLKSLGVLFRDGKEYFSKDDEFFSRSLFDKNKILSLVDPNMEKYIIDALSNKQETYPSFTW